MHRNRLRRVIFRPYRKGAGPTFYLTTWDYKHRDGYGKWVIGYRLTQHEKGKPKFVLFEGEDFHCSPMQAVDSDECLEGIMGFLALRPGDTDAEYFENYTPVQLDFCSQHAEALASEVKCRFGRERT